MAWTVDKVKKIKEEQPNQSKPQWTVDKLQQYRETGTTKPIQSEVVPSPSLNIDSMFVDEPLTWNSNPPKANVNIPGFNINLPTQTPVNVPKLLSRRYEGTDELKKVGSKVAETIANLPIPILDTATGDFKVKDLARPSNSAISLGEKPDNFVEFLRNNAQPDNSINGLKLPSTTPNLDFATYNKEQAQNKLKNSVEALKGKYEPNPLRLGMSEQQATQFEKDNPVLSQVAKIGISGVVDPLNFVGLDLIDSLAKGSKVAKTGGKFADDLTQLGVREILDKEKYLAEKAPTIRKKLENFITESKLRQTPQGKATLNFGKQLALPQGTTKPLQLEASNKIFAGPVVNPKQEFEALKQTMVSKYTQAYDDIVQEIQNKVGNYELNATEQSKYSDLIQQASDNIQKAEYYTTLTPEKLRGKLNAGVIEPEELDYFDRVRQYSDAKNNLQPAKVLQKEIKPIEPNYNLNRGMTEQPKKVLPGEIQKAQQPSFKTEFSAELTPQIKSSRQLPKTLSDAEFDKYYQLDKTPSKKAIENMVEDIGARVINKNGTADIPTIVKNYTKKYNLPDNVKVSFTLKNDLNKATTQPIRDLNGNITGARININPNQSIEGKIGSLRHEIEHYKDLVEGYKEASNKYKFNPKVDKTGKDLYTNASKGHHKNYGWFEYDYLKKAIQEDGLKPTGSIEQPQKASSNIINQPNTNMPQNINKTVSTGEYMKPLDEPRITGSDIAADGQTNTRGFSKNVKTDENMNKDIRDYFTEKPMEYNRLENKKLAAHAENRFKNESLDSLVMELKTKTNFKPEDVPLSRLVANEVAKNGDLKTANEIVSKIAEKLTDAGRFGQAAKVLRKSNPAALMEYLQRTVIKLNEKGAEKYGSKWKNINLSEQVQKEIYNLKLFDEEAIEKAMNKAHDNINEQLPASFMEKVDAWRRMAMLLNPKTHIRNVLGNALMIPARGISETISTVAESVLLKNKPELRTKSFGYKRNKEIVNAVEETWSKYKDDLINGSGRYDIESALSVGNKEKRIFKTNALEKVNVKSKEWLNKGDEIFMQKAFKDSLGGYMKAQNLTSVTDEAIEYATKKAQEATYRQANAFATWLNGAKRSTSKGGKIGGFVADVTIPFVKTPANILKTSYEYSPMGFLSLAKSGKTASEAIDIITKGLTGTGLFVAGCALANMGWARSARENSKNAEALNQMEGQNYNSIITPWGSYSFDWASPIAVPLAMGISVVESFDKKNVSNSWIDKFTNALYNAGNAGLDSLVNMSMLQGIKEALGGYGSNMDKLMGVPQDFISQLIPTLSGQVARVIDPVKRNTYDPNPIKSFGKTVANKIPVASMLLEPKVDTMGEEVTTGNIGKRLLNNFVSPGTALGKNDDKNIKEVARLYDLNKDTSILPKVAPKSFKGDGQEFLLTPQEVTQFQKTLGQNELKGLPKALSKTNDKAKEKALKQLSDDSYNKAKIELLKGRGLKVSIKKATIPTKSLQIKP